MDKQDLFKNIDPNLLAKFKDYHDRNPHIYREFKRYAKEMRKHRAKSSAWLITNRIRWDHDINSNGEDCFKISNDYIALYARLLVFHNKEFEGFFVLKKMKSQGRVLSNSERYDDKELNTL